MTKSPVPEWPSFLPPELRAELESAEDRYIAALDDALSKHLRSVKTAGGKNDGGEPTP